MHPDKVSVLEKATDILGCFSSKQNELGVTEIGRMTGMSKSTVHRLLTALQKADLVKEDPVKRKYRLGFRLLELAGVVLESLDVRNVSRPYMRQLVELTGETTCLYTRTRNHRVCVEQLESPHEIRWAVELGKAYPLLSGASGKVLLAFLPQETIDQIASGSSQGTTIDPNELKADLLQIRESGFAITFGETVEGAAAIAVPIRKHTGDVVAALGVFGPGSRLTHEKMLEYAHPMRSAAQAISEELGYLGKDS